MSKVQRVQELRRSNAAVPHKIKEAAAKDLIQEQLLDMEEESG